MLGLLPIRNYAIGNSRMIFISYTIFTLTNCAVHDKKPIRFWGMYLALMLSFLFCPAFSWIDAWVLTIIHLTSVISSDLNFQRNSKFQELYHNQTVHLSAIYHEIKTPMNGIVCANELIKEELGRIAKQYNHSCDLDKAYEWLEVVRTCSISLSEMIENMLSFSKIQSSTFNLSLTSVYLTEILYSVKQIMNAYPRHPTVQLEWNDKEAEGLWVLGHHIALRQVIINIMTNALKFTERGHVRLTIKNLSDKVEFQISDTGIGMTKSFIQRGLFEPFKQEEAGITGNQRGIGLGMPLSKEMIERMEGSINATSEKGNGTTIRFQLGTVACSSPAPQMSPLTRGDSSCLTDPEVPRVPIHALVVDDNAINRKVMMNLLKVVGFTCTVVESGEEAVSQVRSDLNFDIIFMDVFMPGMGGIEASRQIRRHFREISLAAPMIVGCTADTSEKNISECRENGISNFLFKPINKEELKKIHLKCIKISELIRKRLANPQPQDPASFNL
eukprot:TRINITY_DN630_c0_g1_i5.p1 TRINITY_DN630_c0_g1~~TRINITY_DN630_c0_g1_i5.p1  ORF type:complete len:501 (+),score=154.47 TRINITY_DN630_c0_g1_i5:935-2437(+)